MKVWTYRVLTALDNPAQLVKAFRKAAGPVPTNRDLRFVVDVFLSEAVGRTRVSVAFGHTQYYVEKHGEEIDITHGDEMNFTRHRIRLSSNTPISGLDFGFPSDIPTGWHRSAVVGTSVLFLPPG